MNLEQQLHEVEVWINTELPEWYADGLDVFQEAAEKLLQKGFTVEETQQLLSDLYGAVAAEYGD